MDKQAPKKEEWNDLIFLFCQNKLNTLKFRKKMISKSEFDQKKKIKVLSNLKTKIYSRKRKSEKIIEKKTEI